MFKKILFIIKKYQIHLEFFVVALFILLPVLKNGYILLIDSAFTPKLPWLWDWQSLFFFWWLLIVSLSRIIGSIMTEKIIYLAIVFLILFGNYKLFDTKNQWVKYFCAFFGLFNPFVYSRFLYGQIWVLLAYALLPFLFSAFLDLLNKPSIKKGLLVLFYALLISIFDVRFVLFIFLAFVIIYFFFFLFNFKNKKLLKNNVYLAVKMVILFFVFSSYWLIPVLLGKSEMNQLVNTQIDQRHLSAFRTASDQKYGVILNTAAMYGFWGDREGKYAVQKDMVSYWFELYAVMLLIILWGVVCGLRNPKTRVFTLSFVFIGIFSLILAVGIAYPPFEKLIAWLNNHIPFYKGYREPQKWVAMLILSYIYLGALGVEDLIPRLQSRIKNFEFRISNKFINFILNKLGLAVPALFIMIPLLYSPGMLNGFQGQMYVSNYPASWFEVNELLKNDGDNFKTLFLPWHQYMHFGFAGKVISNPAVNFFEKPVIAGDNMEMGSIYTQTSNPNSQYIEKEILVKKGNLENFGEKLLKLNIKYIILVKESDFFNYDFVDKQVDLEKVYESDKIVVYRNLKWFK